jgi:hypothetical protein
VDGSADGVEAGDLNEDGGHGGRAAGDELDVTQRSQQSCATTLPLGIVPAPAGFEAEGEEEAVELVEYVG